MKRRDLIRHIEAYGCALLKEGAKHSRFVKILATGLGKRLFRATRD